MIKRFAALAMVFVLPFGAMAQDVEKGSNKKTNIEKPSRDFVMFQVTYEGWSNKPDSIKTTGIGRGLNGYICYDFPIKKSHFSFAAGIGIGTANIYLDNQEVVLNDTSNRARFIPESQDYKKYKVTTAYLEAPFELRFFGNNENRNRGFKAAIGFRAGTLVGAHTKAKTDTKIVYKVDTKNYLDAWRFAATARVGWGNFSLMGTYNLNALYKENAGPPVMPYSIGICLTGL